MIGIDADPKLQALNEGSLIAHEFRIHNRLYLKSRLPIVIYLLNIESHTYGWRVVESNYVGRFTRFWIPKPARYLYRVVQAQMTWISYIFIPIDFLENYHTIREVDDYLYKRLFPLLNGNRNLALTSARLFRREICKYFKETQK